VSSVSCSFPALGTTALLCVTRREALPGARAVLERMLAAADSACSRFRTDSELSLLNARPGVEVAVGEMLFEAIAVAVRAAAATDGLVDPTVGRSLRLAGYDRTFELVRARDARGARFVPAAGWQRVELDPDRRTVRLPAGAELDLGATEKALAADRAAAGISARLGCGALVSLGGDVAVAGPAPAGGWPIRVADDHAAPLDSSGPVVSITTGGLASSGTAVRRWRAGGTELHHIVDPRTGRPATTPWRTVTVAAASCVDANVAATAAIVLGAGAPAWLAARDLPSRLLSEAGVATCVAGWPEEDLAA
jgi:FAD:protein FMN transferase